MKTIKHKLGYRIVLENAVLPKVASTATGLKAVLQLENKGYASPYNPRPVQLILRNKKTGKLFKLDFNTKIQKWFSGTVKLQQQFILPANIIKGEYEMLLNLPDGYKSLQKNTAYSIHLANENIWEASTGFNSLQHIIQIK